MRISEKGKRMKQDIEIGIDTQSETAGGCCGGDCCGGGQQESLVSNGLTTEVLVEGMTCSHCVNSVIDEVSAVEGVQGVTVSIVPGGQSRVFIQSESILDERAIQAAVEEAGYRTVLT